MSTINASSYNPVTTATKAGFPVVVIFILKFIIQWSGSHIGTPVDDDAAYKASVGLWGAIIGAINWWKNRKR